MQFSYTVFTLVVVSLQLSGVVSQCVDTNPKCKDLKDMCDDPGLGPMMEAQCQLTCGFCIPDTTKAGVVATTKAGAVTTKAPATTKKSTVGPNPVVTTTVKPPTTASSCKDDPNTDCAKYISLCGNPDYRDLMNSFCPKTCNLCGNSSCVDDPNTDCAKYLSLCSKPEYKDLMVSFCPKTCNFCGRTSCEDKDHRCEQWALNGYCTNPFYRPEDRVVCQKTCAMC